MPMVTEVPEILARAALPPHIGEKAYCALRRLCQHAVRLTNKQQHDDNH